MNVSVTMDPAVNSSIISSNSPTTVTMEMKEAIDDEKKMVEVDVGQTRRSRKGVGKSGRSKAKCAGHDKSSTEHDVHIWTERERRKKMRNMFAGLHNLLPQLPAKVDKSTIVDEAVSYIKTLQQTLRTLQNQKLERLKNAMMIENDEQFMMAPQAVVSREAYLADYQGSISNNNSPINIGSQSVQFPANFQTWFSPNVVMSMCGEDAHICICSAKKAGLFATITYILEKHKLDVVSAHISSDQYRSMYMIHAHAGESCQEQFPEAFSVEEVFKLAVGEMNLWLLSF